MRNEKGRDFTGAGCAFESFKHPDPILRNSMELTTFTFVACNVIIFSAFLVRSLTGFGSALISIPLLALLFDLKFIVPLESLLEVGFTILLIPKLHKRILVKILLPLIGGALLGSFLGTHFLMTIENDYLKKILGGLVIGFALYYSFAGRRERKTSISPSWGFLAGATGGVFGGVFGTSGPPYVAYLALQLDDKEILRATLVGMFAFDYSWRTTVFALSGLYHPQLLLFALALAPSLVLGTILGHFIHFRLSYKIFQRMIAMILIAAGLFLVW